MFLPVLIRVGLCADLVVKYTGNVFIPDSAYENKTTFKSVEIQSGFQIIGKYAFRNTLLESVVIPSTIREIRDQAFDKTKLTKINIPNGVQSLAWSCFARCTNLVTINIPASVNNIGVSVFHSCSSSAKITVNSGNTIYESRTSPVAMIVKKSGTDRILVFTVNKLASLTLPNDITIIGNSGAYGLKAATSISCPKVHTIENYGFRHCTKLQTLTLSKYFEKLGAAAFVFENCKALAKIVMAQKSTNYECDSQGILYKRTSAGLEVAMYPAMASSTFAIPSGMKNVVGSAFSGSSVKEFKLSGTNDYLSVYDGIVYNKGGTKLICCPPKIKSSFKFNSKVNEIGAYSFSALTTEIATMTIPGTVTTIGAYAFSKCDTIKSIVLHDKITSLHEYCFHEMKCITSLTLPKGITIIPNSMAAYSAVAEVIINGQVTIIQGNAFAYCYALKKINFPASLKEIWGTAFSTCKVLPTSQLKLPEGLEYIGVSAFDGCQGLTGTVTIPGTVRQVASKAFYMCSNINLVEIRNCNTMIGLHAFLGAKGTIQTVCIITKEFTSPMVLQQVLPKDVMVLAASILSVCLFI